MKEKSFACVDNKIFVESNSICPNCENSKMKIFYKKNNIPSHSVLIFNNPVEAINYPKGNISLGFCEKCGFVGNLDFDLNLRAYSEKYEETQGFSETFQKFHIKLAQKLIENYNIRNKSILEIGCGKGEFISMMCELADNKGYGFDPAYIPERNNSPAKDKIVFIRDYYSEKYSNYKADFFVCKMTLEHIPDTLNFLNQIRKSIDNQYDSLVFFQIPNFEKILMDCAFWDIYYEHCSYFTFCSLAELFRNARFEVIDLELDYDDQYLMIIAKPSELFSFKKHKLENEIEDLKTLIETFSKNVSLTMKLWRKFFEKAKSENKKIILWGGGSKAVAFLTTLNLTSQIVCVVDINPYKNNTYLPGTGHLVINPSSLKNYSPDIVIVMNPIYVPEIKKTLNSLELFPEIIPIDSLNVLKYKE